MRVSTFNTYSSSLYRMQNLTSEIAKLNEMQATSTSILRPSDDPIGSVKMIGNQRDMAATEQYINNIESLSSSFSRAETNLSSVVELQNRMREITISANNGSLSPKDRAAYGAEMSELLGAFTDTLNAKDESGNYLFSGNKTDTAPIAIDDSGHYTYQGDNKLREVQTSSSSWVSANVTGDALIFSNGSDDILNQTQDFIKALKDPALAPGNAAFDDVATAMLESLDDTLTSTSRAITDIGGKQNSLSLVQSSHEEMKLFNDTVIGEIQGLDHPKAQAEITANLVVLEITQKTFVQVSQLSLFNQL
ncbi:flagellar hook-associated protein FlgL [Shewanella sp. VB17]|uniref:flagellar hook-associated protein FlgL n=1 Tax=Shewanella sp. VB17 TaxID=2739432 RepID=UPI0015674911|nr:flagellar hook-associated protein FlgL [Shewanella sp. VB17]NRD72014.1 flagellar hook-associated protein FlgL [Shewanella sp. VB17]